VTVLLHHIVVKRGYIFS